MAAIDQEARTLYDAGTTPRPRWDQLGDVTRSVWRGYAKLKLAGVKDWWAIHHTMQSRASGVLRQQPTGVFMSLNTKQVADVLDEIAELFSKLSGSFRSGDSDSGSGGVDGKAVGKVPAKPTRPASKAKPAAEEPAEVTEDDVREKLKELAGAKGKDAMVAALESVGASKLAEVDETQYAELIEKVDELLAEEDEPVKPAKKTAPAKKVAAKKAGPTMDEVVEAAKALIDADKAAYVKLTKKLGKPTEMDESGYADAIAAYEAAMPADDDNLI